MTKEERFVNELIGYIFAYPDDDYMTMECLCRKLHKYGLIDKKDGEWTTDFIDRKTEPSGSEIPNNCEPQTIRCPKCGRTDYIRDMEKDMGIKGSHYKYKCINCNTYIKDEPQTERSSE